MKLLRPFIYIYAVRCQTCRSLRSFAVLIEHCAMCTFAIEQRKGERVRERRSALTWPAGASSKWQFVFHLGTISRLDTLHHPRTPASPSRQRQNAGNEQPWILYYTRPPWLMAGCMPDGAGHRRAYVKRSRPRNDVAVQWFHSVDVASLRRHTLLLLTVSSRLSRRHYDRLIQLSAYVFWSRLSLKDTIHSLEDNGLFEKIL